MKQTSGVGSRAADLGAQQVEVLRRGRGHRDAEVVPRAQRQEPLDAPARVLGTLTLVAVGKEEDEARELAPLVLGGHEEVVDDDLGAVHEVAELRLPGDERVGALDRVAVLEAHRGVLAQQRVADGEVPGRAVEVAERDELASGPRSR